MVVDYDVGLVTGGRCLDLAAAPAIPAGEHVRESRLTPLPFRLHRRGPRHALAVAFRLLVKSFSRGQSIIV